MTDTNNPGYRAFRTGSALVELPARGAIVVTGSDRLDFLQGLLTNDIAGLAHDEGCYAAYLTPLGRIIADMRVFHLGDEVLLDVHGDVKDQLVDRFGSLVFAEDVGIVDRTSAWNGVELHGPTALTTGAAVLGDGVAGFGPLPVGRYLVHRGALATATGEVIVARIDELGMPGLRLWIPRQDFAGRRGELLAAGAVESDHATAETIRIESGLPSFPEDMDTETIPLEAGIEGRAISLTKGCYVGQEVIIRVLHRGQGRVARKLVGLTLDATGEDAAGSAVGRVTSATYSPLVGGDIALGYVPRELAEPGAELIVAFGERQRRAVVSKTPFVADAQAQP